MSTAAFRVKKKEGMWFQGLLYPLMEKAGLEVVDTDHLSQGKRIINLVGCRSSLNQGGLQWRSQHRSH